MNVFVSVCVCHQLCHNLSFSLPQTTLAGHFQNATVGFLQPIGDPITISFATLLFAHNDRRNVSLVCPRLSSPPLTRSLSVFVAVSQSDPLSPTLSRSVSFSHPPPTPHTHPCQLEMREGENYRTVCIFPELLKSALMLMADHVH